MMDRKKATTRSIDLAKLYNSHLSIQLSLDGFSFCVIDKTDDRIQKLVHHSYDKTASTPEKLLHEVREVFTKEELLQQKFGSVNISHLNELSSLVPRSLFDENKLKEYVRYSSKTFDNDYIVYDEIENHDLVNVYIPFVNVNNYFIDRFGSFEYKHFSTVLISNLLDTYKFSEHPHIFVHVEKSRIYLVAISGNKLLLYNSFPYRTREDFVYYILFVAEQLGMDPESFELVLSGLIDKQSELYTMARSYVRKIGLIENRFKTGFESSVSESAKRRHMTLIQQY